MMRVLAGIVAAVIASPVVAEPVVDQNFAPAATGPYEQIFYNMPMHQSQSAQTVTVGITGLLTRIDVWLGSLNQPQNVFLRVRSVTNGVIDPSEDPLVEVAGVAPIMQNEQDLQLVSFDVGAALLPYTVGDIFAFSIEALPSSAGVSGRVSSSSTADYLGGSAYRRSFVDSWFPGALSGASDIHFRTYVVESDINTPVPEPALSLLIGMGAFAVLRRPKKRVAGI